MESNSSKQTSMGDVPDELQELYCKYGRTAEMAQVMEFEAGNLALAFISVWFDPKTITDEQRHMFQGVIDDVDKRTFGNLLKQIRKTVTISEKIEQTVTEALEKRNYLTHRFFKKHNFAINSEEGKKVMIAELDDIYRALNLAHAVLSGMTHTLNQAFGWPNVSKEEVLELINGGKRVDI
ncbi:MAG TPA: hypothetical protein VLB46_16480 [Pyrinomonadaceae bacterium]|nr:hypothetical protein [Pyrinomonadaceae bacterium]